jgi:uncharacterized membrane protein YtjA (UPF0391 family)
MRCTGWPVDRLQFSSSLQLIDVRCCFANGMAQRLHDDVREEERRPSLVIGTGNRCVPGNFCSVTSGKDCKMLHYAVVFFVIALIAALFGFTGIAVGAAEIAKVLFVIFLILFIVSLVVGMFRRGP